jgi:hypothetical protein
MTSVNPGTAPILRLKSLADRLVAIEAEKRQRGDFDYVALVPEAAAALRELAAIKFEAWKVENPEQERYVPPKRWRGD